MGALFEKSRLNVQYYGHDASRYMGIQMKQRNLQVIEDQMKTQLDLQYQLFNLRTILPDGDTQENDMMFYNRLKKGNRKTRAIELIPKRMNMTSLYHRSKYVADRADLLRRSPRFLKPLSLPLGIFGTFMGLYNRQQIDRLRTDMKVMIQKHDKLVEVVEKQIITQGELQESLKELEKHLVFATLNNPAYTLSSINLVEDYFREQLQRITHVLQSAQNRRLAIDLLSPNQLADLYDSLIAKSERNGYQLLTNHPSDLFQVEVSYFYDGYDLHLLLHVPMVPKDSLLRLFRFHPFPIELSPNHTLVPDLEEDVLALSSGFTRLSSTLSYADLMGCLNINNIYLCEQQGVLRTDLHSTCMGALYKQDLESAQELCKFRIHDSGEDVKQLLNNWFLIYSPTPQTIPIVCHNGTQSEKPIPSGTSSMHLSPGCRAQLQRHLVISDLSLRLDSDVIHYEWNWQPRLLKNLPTFDLDPLVDELQTNGIPNPLLSDVIELKMHQRSRNSMLHIIINSIGIAFCVVSVIVTGIYVFIRFKIHQRVYRVARRERANGPPPPSPPTHQRFHPDLYPDLETSSAVDTTNASEFYGFQPK
jgi:hypothetical protein